MRLGLEKMIPIEWKVDDEVRFISFLGYCQSVYYYYYYYQHTIGIRGTIYSGFLR